MNIYGFVNIELGDGGSGFTAGGAGASLLTGTFTQTITPYVAGAGLGSTHLGDSRGDYVPLIGNQQAIDFDGDGIGDLVYTTVDTSQLVVVFGAQDTSVDVEPGDPVIAYNTRPDRIYLSGVRNAEALTVADVNRDGHPDIIVGSSDPGNRSGIVVFLSKFEDLNNDGIPSGSEDLNGNGVNDFLGFYDGRFSTLPQLTGFDTNPLVNTTPYRGNEAQPYKVNDQLYAASATAIGQIVAGDFDGDGRPELAVTANYSGWEVLLFLTADIEEDDLSQPSGKEFYTGQFYADYGTKSFETPGGITAPDPRKPYLTLFQGGPGRAVIQATALSDSADHDVVLVAPRDLGSDGGPRLTPHVATIDYMTRESVLTNGKYFAQSPAPIGFFDLGVVDRNREIGDTDMEGAYALDFAVVDDNEDGFADVIAITGDTAGYGYMVGSRGDGSGSGLSVSGTGDQAGYYFGPVETNMSIIRAVDGDGDGSIDDVVVYGDIPGGGGYVLEFVPGAGNVSLELIGFLGPAPAPGGQHFADVWYPDATNIGAPALMWAAGTSNISFLSIGAINGDANAPMFPNDEAYSISNAQPGFNIAAGDGGNSIVGNGGVGGGIGSGSKLQSFTTDDPIT
ncbi:MAG: VCBS repeat-containing protein, partial [Verrucomicrobiaceae bacterium]